MFWPPLLLFSRLHRGAAYLALGLLLRPFHDILGLMHEESAWNCWSRRHVTLLIIEMLSCFAIPLPRADCLFGQVRSCIKSDLCRPHLGRVWRRLL